MNDDELARHRSLPVWQPPDLYREVVAEADQTAQALLAQLRGHEGALLIPAIEIELLAHRLARLIARAHNNLPPHVI